MLENPIGRSPKAWGLATSRGRSFSPARGAHFSIKCGQTPNLEVRWGGVNLPGGAKGCQGWGHVGLFFVIFWHFYVFYHVFVYFVRIFGASYFFFQIFFDFLSILGRLLEEFARF